MPDVSDEYSTQTQDESSLELDEIEPSDDLDFEHFFDGDFGQSSKQPSHDEPAVRGLK